MARVNWARHRRARVVIPLSGRPKITSEERERRARACVLFALTTPVLHTQTRDYAYVVLYFNSIRSRVRRRRRYCILSYNMYHTYPFSVCSHIRKSYRTCNAIILCKHIRYGAISIFHFTYTAQVPDETRRTCVKSVPSLCATNVTRGYEIVWCQLHAYTRRYKFDKRIAQHLAKKKKM